MNANNDGLIIEPTEIGGYVDPNSFGVFSTDRSVYYGAIRHGMLRDGQVWACPADTTEVMPDDRSAALYLRLIAEAIPVLRKQALGVTDVE
jgi:hypothetical protein